ncbi:MAG: ribonuclease HII [Candidatus Riflebacteria bacterium]|nr:ribonuclease HII [Candidatus Riflebacteria bacterium]
MTNEKSRKKGTASGKISQPTAQIENHFRELGYELIAGGDEAGRGPWAGPVFAAFVILPQKFSLEDLNDSKKLSRNVRTRLFKEIKQQAQDFGIGISSEQEIDQMNILEATRLAFKRAFENLKKTPDFLILDYIKLPWLKVSHEAFVKGDSLSVSIAAASILAKEARDLHMDKMDSLYPGYGFGNHKGYGTPEHVKSLEKLGPSPIHRKSFKPVKKYLQPNLPL